MAELEFKYLNEIDISDSLTDSAHVIVEDGGNIRRAPMGQLITGGGVSSWNDLIDKPFYEEGSFEEILPETTLTMNNVSGMGMGSIVVDHTKITLGKIYKMVWDGVTYEAPAFEVSGQSGEGGEVITLVAIGNPAIGNFGEDNGIPFFAGNAANGEGMLTDNFMVITTDTAATHTLSISVGSITVHTLDEKFIPDIIARKSDLVNVGGASSWNDLTDKPFYEEGNQTVIEWDGNTEGRDFISLGSDAPDGVGIYKVSENTPTKEELINGTVTMLSYTDNEEGDYLIESDYLLATDDFLIVGDGEFVVVYTEGATVGDSTAPSTGIYFVHYPDMIRTVKLTYGSTTIHTLDEKFIPDTIARVEDVGVKSWNELEDKPFGETTSLTELHSETLTFDTELANFYRADCIDFNYVFEAGKTYTVIWDGISYSCTAYTHTPSGYVVIGDYGFANSTGEPFYAFYNDIVSSVRFVVQETGTHTIVVCGEEAVTKTLDEKFIPDTIARKSDIQSGSGLPEVTTENNGQILGVADGVWGVMDAPSGVSSWNDLTDRPIVTTSGEITWDGNTEDRDTFSFGGLSYYKIADIPSGKFVLTSSTDSSGAVLNPGDFSWGTIHHGGAVLYKGNYVFIVESTMIYVSEDNITEVPSPGIYFGLIKYHGQTGYTQAVTYKIESIDEKCIPDTIARKSDIQSGSGLPEVTTENNGAFLRVVDGAWAIVNMTDVSTEGA